MENIRCPSCKGALLATKLIKQTDQKIYQCDSCYASWHFADTHFTAPIDFDELMDNLGLDPYSDDVEVLEDPQAAL